jgi:serine/threonine protein phosphatase PrpC
MKRVEQAHLIVHAVTHEGKRGKENEDRYGVSAYERSDRQSTPVLLAVLADGIGGHRAGEVAAEMAVNLISTRVAEADEDQQPAATLQAAISAASQAINKHAKATPGREGMGATCAIAYTIGTRLFTANVGDSRIYLMRGGKATQLSTDHTWIQEALERGVLTPDQVKGHPNSHVIRRFLGSSQPPEAAICQSLNGEDTVENEGIQLLADDIILLCSDGLTDLVKDEEISAALDTQPMEEAANGLVDLANERGGHDNITIVLLQVPHEPIKKRQPTVRFWLTGILLIVATIVLVIAVWFGYNWFFRQETPTPTPTIQWTLPALSTGSPDTTPAATANSNAAEPRLNPLASPTLRAFPTPQGGATITPWPTSTVPPGTSYP